MKFLTSIYNVIVSGWGSRTSFSWSSRYQWRTNDSPSPIFIFFFFSFFLDPSTKSSVSTSLRWERMQRKITRMNGRQRHTKGTRIGEQLTRTIPTRIERRNLHGSVSSFPPPALIFALLAFAFALLSLSLCKFLSFFGAGQATWTLRSFLVIKTIFSIFSF